MSHPILAPAGRFIRLDQGDTWAIKPDSPVLPVPGEVLTVSTRHGDKPIRLGRMIEDGTHKGQPTGPVFLIDKK